MKKLTSFLLTFVFLFSLSPNSYAIDNNFEQRAIEILENSEKFPQEEIKNLLNELSARDLRSFNISKIYKERETFSILRVSDNNIILKLKPYIVTHKPKRDLLKKEIRKSIISYIFSTKNSDFYFSQLYNLNISQNNWKLILQNQNSNTDLLDNSIENWLNSLPNSSNSDLLTQEEQALNYFYWLNSPQIIFNYDFSGVDFSKINFFNNSEDLNEIFEVLSYRERNVEKDPPYRKHNIQNIYKTISESGMKVLNPNETLNFYDIYKEASGKYWFQMGYAIFWNSERAVYWGGVCGGATGLNHSVLTNKGISVSGRNHSTYYHSLYDSIINWEIIKTPGLDKTYFDINTNVVLKNITEHPIVLVNKIDDKKEVNFSFGLRSENLKWTFEFLKQEGNCYYWNINGTVEKSCYNKIKG